MRARISHARNRVAQQVRKSPVNRSGLVASVSQILGCLAN
jgi:hypothetical protein